MQDGRFILFGNDIYVSVCLYYICQHASESCIVIAEFYSKLNYKLEVLHGSLILEYDVVRIAV
jgi:hypothetical protein